MSEILRTIVIYMTLAAAGVGELVREHQGSLTDEERQSTYYLSLLPAEGEDQRDLERAIRLMIASSSRQQVLEHCLPQRIGASPVMTIDIADLEWPRQVWLAALKTYPYSPSEHPALVRADWLLVTLADDHESGGLYRKLLFGLDDKGQPLTKRDQVLNVLGVSKRRDLQWGAIEANSGVAVNKIRLIRSLAIDRSSAWGTRDVLEVTAEKDPLENLAGDFQHDGEEWIIPLHKLSLLTGQRGHLQAYFLSDGKGNLVDRAPVDLVEDSTRVRGVREIRNCVSCIACHKTGMNLPTKNDVLDFIGKGGQIYTGKQNRVELIRFYGSDLISEMQTYNERYAKAAFVAGSLTAEDDIEDVAESFIRAVRRYDAPLDLTACAVELGTPPARLQAALAVQGVAAGARLVGLVHGRTIPRKAWEDQYLQAASFVKQTGE